MNVRGLALLVVLLGGCASSAAERPSGIAAPDLRIGRGSGPSASSGNRMIDGGLSILLKGEVLNRSDVDLVLDRLDVRSVGYGGVFVPNTIIPLDLQVPSRETVPFERWIATQVQQQTIAGAGGPVTLRVAAWFSTDDGVEFREFYNLEF